LISVPKACVIGDPIGHSLSPLLHTTWLRQTGAKGCYTSLHLKPDEFVSGIANLAADPNFVGANITLPYKQEALLVADTSTKIATSIGAANLLIRKNNKFLADNTDAAGFIGPLLCALGLKTLQGKTVLVFGAGGAARAVLEALLCAGVERVFLCNRSDSRAKILLQELLIHDPKANVKLLKWSERNRSDCQPDIIVNASSAGMTGFDSLDINLGFYRTVSLVYDLVYQPILTPLLAQSKELGLVSLGGLDMLISQAKPCFIAFFGIDPPSDNTAKLALLRALQVMAGSGQ